MSDYFSKPLGSNYFSDSETESQKKAKRDLKNERLTLDETRYHKSGTKIIVKRYAIKSSK